MQIKLSRIRAVEQEKEYLYHPYKLFSFLYAIGVFNVIMTLNAQRHPTFGCKYLGIFAKTAIDSRVTSNGKKGVREGQIDKLKKLRRLS